MATHHASLCRLGLSVTVLLAVSLAPASAADWPSWRGPASDGVSTETGLPSSWSPEGENLLWKAPIGGRSTPIVLDGRVCILTLAEPDTPQKWQEQIACLDADTGELVWEYRYNVFQTDIPHHRIGWANLVGDAETGYVYSHGVEGMVYCFDREGKVVWSRPFTEEVGRISGFGGRTVNPILDGNLVIVSFLSVPWWSTPGPKHRFYALDKKTGDTVWVSEPGGRPLDTTYSAPVVRVINGERLLVAGNGDGGVYGMRVATGEKVWGFKFSKRGINSSVVVDGSLVYASHSEENLDGSTDMGRLVCLDAAQVTDGKPREVWRAEGFTGGYASPAIHEGRLYHVDNSANVTAFDAKTGKQLWLHNIGIAQKASPVVADGKIYVSDVDGQFHILKMRGDEEPEVLDVDEFKNPDGSATQINGSAAIANGRVYLLTNNALYCIGKKKSGEAGSAPATPSPERAPADAEPAFVQVVPGEVVLSAGSKHQFPARVFDAKGRLIGEADATWTLEGIEGSISSSGELTLGDANRPQGGMVVATVGSLKNSARVSSRPVIRFEENFDRLEEKSIPGGWNFTKGRFQAATVEGAKVLKKLSGNPRGWRTTVYIGDPNASGYVIEADLLGTEQKRRMPDMGLVSHRYTMALMGNRQQLTIRTWLSEFERFSKVIKFRWDPDVWYRVKMQVDLEPEGGEGTVRGKVWKKGEPEPAEWTIEAVDPIPHRNGSPGIYGYSSAEILYDNVSITPRGG